ncbi:hypothetical protein Vadar_024486 [Vaccinium darrowii]|uniref:Uncharacterized protein n=1 Tax=Vaccinium darrowii TaxID=229202 RepID=A0ACB7XCH5_9ERIC|nr:hypothetical protein Vadar_024486 [Vaccinium darrowii]
MKPTQDMVYDPSKIELVILIKGLYWPAVKDEIIFVSFVLLHTVPVLYEKPEDRVNPLAEKALAEFKKIPQLLYAVFDAKVLSKIPRGYVVSLEFKKQ